MKFTHQVEIDSIYKECKDIVEINRLMRLQEILIVEFQETLQKQIKQLTGAIWMVNSKIKKE